MTQSVDPSPQSSPPSPTEKGSWLGAFIFHLFLLGLGSFVAIIGGLTLAVFSPRLNPPKPLIVKGWELWHQQQTSLSSDNSEPRQFQQQIQQLEAQLQELNQQTSQLESQLGIQNPDQSIETRLQRLQSQASEISQTSEPDTVQLVQPIGQLKVTLPSALLFTDNSNTLATEANRILETIIVDLGQHPGSTIRIAAHTDGKNSEQENRELSFQQGRAIETYLDNILEGDYRWVVIGYGSTLPLENLNRRIEISIN